MELQKYLGIYISKDSATVVCAEPGAGRGEVSGCFTVGVEDQAEAWPHALASLISQGCSERQWEFAEVSVALDCAMFMQHNVHSEFRDPKQIAATVRFDTEEALATDVSDAAISFQITSSGEQGSELTVFTAKKQMLSDIILSLQSSGMDPAGIEPDVNCLLRYLCGRIPPEELDHGGTIFGFLSSRSGYLIAPCPDGLSSERGGRVRTFLVSRATDRTALLAREAIMTAALSGGGEPISRIRVFDSVGSIDYKQLGERLGLEAAEMDLLELSGGDREQLADCGDPVDFAIAYGAALGLATRAPAANFRDDFMPYQGKKVKLQKTLRYFSLSVTVLLVAVGLYFQTQLFSVNKYRQRVRARFATDYSTVILNSRLPAEFKFTTAEKTLEKVKRRLAKDPSLVDTGSAASKLTLVLDALNKSAAQTNLNIKSVSISPRSMTIIGDTSSPANTLRFFATVKSSGLAIISTNQSFEGGRDKFRIGLEPIEK